MLASAAAVTVSPDSLFGRLLLVLLLQHGELVGEILLTDPHGVAPHVRILTNTCTGEKQKADNQADRGSLSHEKKKRNVTKFSVTEVKFEL